MAQRAFPLNNTKYYAKDVQMFHIGRTSGVYNLQKDNLRVYSDADSRMDVLVNSGYAFLFTGTSGQVGGITYENTEAERFTISTADTTTRYDYIAVRFDVAENNCVLVLQKGSNSQPTPIRNDQQYEIILAVIEVLAGATQITDANITDTRLKEDYCGIVVDTCADIPTEAYDAQFKSFMDEKKTEVFNDINQYNDSFNSWSSGQKETMTSALKDYDTQFNNWFNKSKETLDGDVAGKLSNRIDTVEKNITAVNKNIDDVNDLITKINTDMKTETDRIDTLEARQEFNYKVGTATPTTSICPEGFFYFKIEG